MGLSNQIPASRLIQPGVVSSAATRPASPFTGQCIFQTDTNQLLVWNGTAWVIPNSPAQNPGGLELISTQTLTSATSVNFDNVFTSTYRNYRIVYSFTDGGANTAEMRMRVGGSSTSGTTNYAYTRVYLTGTGTFANNGGSTGAAFGGFANLSSTGMNVGSWDVFAPALAQYTNWTGGGNYSTLGEYGFIVHKLATAYDGFGLTQLVSSNGKISVYGYRE
jgi:hypothetical protein